MQLAVLSDVHGNLPALEAVLDDLQQYPVDGIIVAGDIVIGGPQGAETLQRLRALDSLMVLGNGDVALLSYADGTGHPAWYTYHEFAPLRWVHRHAGSETLDFLRTLHEQRVVELPGTAAIRVVHGSPRHVAESIFPDRDPEVLEAALALTSEPVLVCGHTHIPWQVERDGRLVLNPGAVFGPLDGFVGAQYALLRWYGDCWQAEHRTVSYDLERVSQAYRDSGLMEEGGAFVRGILLGIKTGHDVVDDFFSYARGLAAKAGISCGNVIPDEFWDQASLDFDWAGYERP